MWRWKPDGYINKFHVGDTCQKEVTRNLGATFPVVLILILLLFSYFAFVVGLCIFQLMLRCSSGFYECHTDKMDGRVRIFLHFIHGAAYLVLYHVFLMLFIVSYFRAVFTKAGPIPQSFFEDQRFGKEEEEQKEDKETHNPNAATYCKQCEEWRPPRAHHCM